MSETPGRDPFQQDENGRTILFDAAERGDRAAVEKIIFRLSGTGVFCQRLSLLTIKDDAGLDAADVAEQNGHIEIANLLRGEVGRMEFFE